MRNNRLRRLQRILCGLVCAGLLFSQPSVLLAAEDSGGYSDEYDDSYDESGEVLTPTPTPDPHTKAYYQEPDSNSIKGWPQGPKVEAEAAVLIDVDTEAILYSKNADKQLYPASITKIMTALVACENLKRKDKLVMSEAAAYGIEAGSSSIYADTGEEFTVHQALMALMLESANEIALALGEKTSGSVKKFVELMNTRAAQLGCTGTHFNNPHGLPDETHCTTANDMAKIARCAWMNRYYRKYVTTDIYEIPPTNVQPETRYLLNHHKMMAGRDYAYDGVLGGKTGYTEAAGNTLVTYAKRGNTTLCAVVLNSINGAYPDTAALLDYGFNSFEKADLNVAMDPVPSRMLACEKYILKNSGNTFPFYYKTRVYATVPKGTDTGTLARRQALLANAVGPLRLKSKYYFNDRLVGWGMQYEKEILSDLLIQPSL